MKSVELTGDLEKLPEIAEKILKFAGETRVWTFTGDLGAGKTTLIKEICRKLSVEEMVSSPTFSLVNEYLTESGESIYHFDFYRLNNFHEVLDIGAEEYFDSGNYCFIEWPQVSESLLPDRYIKIEIHTSENKRIFQVEKM